MSEMYPYSVIAHWPDRSKAIFTVLATSVDDASKAVKVFIKEQEWESPSRVLVQKVTSEVRHLATF